MTLYDIYYVSEKSSIVPFCNANNLKIVPSNTCVNQYSIIFCTPKFQLLGTGTLSSVNNGMQQIDVQFNFTTNGIIMLNQDGTNGILQIYKPDKPVQTYNLNYNFCLLPTNV